MSNLIVADVEIRQDSEGRYNLTDLHKASGGAHKDQPNRWMRSEKTEELIKSLNTQNWVIKPVEAKAGRYGGTYVCEELVFDYAMWISPDFKIKVIRAFSTLQKKGIAVADHAVDALLDDPLEYFEEVLQQAKKIKAERDRLKHERDGVVKTIGQTEQTITRFVRTLPGVNSPKIKSDLKALGYLWRVGGNGTYRVYSQYRDKFFTEKHTEDGRQVDIHVTPDGKALLGRLYEEGKLTMKKGYERV